jgi:hypothetical protein
VVLVNLFSYIVACDAGFSPNPFWGYCTLACCKPTIRRTASVGDLIVGLSPKGLGHRVVYVMRVTGKMSFADYWRDRRYERKRPNLQLNERRACGDNIYRPLAGGRFRQQPSGHSMDDGRGDERTKAKDLRGRFVLVSRDFVYYGAKAIELPPRFRGLIVGRGHRKLALTGATAREIQLLRDFESFFCQLPRGRVGWPTTWADQSACRQRMKKDAKCGHQGGPGT